MKHATTGKTIPTVEDLDNPPTTLDDWGGAVMKQGGVVLGTTPRRRGPGKKPTRTPIQLRLLPDTLAHRKATGPGWQTLGQTTLKNEFSDYRYGKADWLRERESGK